MSNKDENWCPICEDILSNEIYPTTKPIWPPEKYVASRPDLDVVPTQRERIVVQLLSGFITTGMEDTEALNKAFDLADIVIKRLKAL